MIFGKDILMDIQLPVVDGYETTRRIKADPSMSTILIIAVASYALGEEDARATLQRRPSENNSHCRLT
jgi:CheY-like chemotaxis protein